MKKTYFILFICYTSINFSLFSQISVDNTQQIARASKHKILDTTIIATKYRMLIENDAQHPQNRKKEYFMILQVGKQISKFSDYFSLKSDSLSTILAAQKTTINDAMNKMIAASNGTNRYSLNIFKNYPINKTTTTDRIPLGDTYKFSENKVKPLWRMESGSLLVCGYQCKKAITTFRGRNYIAWYAPKIPISDGPWKFWGLPGLILKISDDKGHYSFECVSIEKPKYTSEIYILDLNYINTTKVKFNDALKKFYENPRAAMEASGKIKSGLPDKIKSRPYNPIELSE